MHLDLLRNYLAHRAPGGASAPAVSRRTALTLGAATAGSIAALAGAGRAGAAGSGASGTRPGRQETFGDEFFDYADPAKLDEWRPSIYGAGDERGAFNEVTPAKTADALKMLQRGQGQRGVTTFQLGELMTNGFPAYVTNPPRIYEQRLVANGYVPPPEFEAEGGILQGTVPQGANRINVHEERFACVQADGFDEPYSTTYQIGTQLDNLNHVGAGDFYYNGFRGPDIARGWGPPRWAARTWVRSSPAACCSTSSPRSSTPVRTSSSGPPTATRCWRRTTASPSPTSRRRWTSAASARSNPATR